jgi:hypothetical protein
MDWRDVIKKEWDLSQRWTIGMGFQDRGKVSEEEIIRTYEYVLEKFNGLIDNYDSDVKTSADAKTWLDEYSGIRNMHYSSIFHQAKDSDNQHIKMLMSDIKDLEDGKYTYENLHFIAEYKPKTFEKLTAKEIGLEWLSENINDMVGMSELHREGDEG